MSRGELFVELLTEELPPSMIEPAVAGLRDGLVNLLTGIEYGAIETFATPRRVAVRIADVADARPSVERVVTGPPADRAFVNGEPTPAAIGFAKGKGVDVGAIEILDTPKGKVVAVRVREGGERTDAIVGQGLEQVVLAIPFRKSMEWGAGGLRFGRPLRQVAGLYGGEVLRGEVAGKPIVATTVAHRFATDPSFAFRSCEEWLAGLRARDVEPDVAARRARIRAILDEASAELRADHIDDDALIDQVTALVEWPTQVIGTFEQDLLHLPPRLLVESMKVHQRCFPVHVGRKLTNRFVIVSNSPKADPKNVEAGFARVLRARFFDARFFFAEDKKKSLKEHGEGLVRMRWIRGLGTVAQKQARAARLGAELASLAKADAAVVAAAGAQCKCDLLTQMVREFPELQGHMGKLYATAEGQDDAVAIAIEEHYQPRFAGDAVAATPAGIALAIADRIDTLVGCFGVGMAPKGGGDPQGLRRAAGGLVATLIAHELRVDLQRLFGQGVRLFHAAVRDAPEGYEAWVKERGTGELPNDAEGLVAQLVEFTLARLEAQAVQDGASADVVDAVVDGAAPDVVVLSRKLAALRKIAGTPDFVPIMQTFKRVLNISAKAEGNPDDRRFTEPAERELDAALGRVAGDVEAAIATGDYGRALDAMLTLREPVARFFDDVLVDDPDAAIKARRIGLLQRISATFRQVADFSRISTR